MKTMVIRTFPLRIDTSGLAPYYKEDDISGSN